jgi:hypothetical protein
MIKRGFLFGLVVLAAFGFPLQVAAEQNQPNIVLLISYDDDYYGMPFNYNHSPVFIDGRNII